jgi:hypothetical protein
MKSDSKSAQSEAERFDAALTKIMSVSHGELKRRERQWKNQRKAKKANRVKKTHDGGLSMTDQEIQQSFWAMRYNRGIRKPPDNRRHCQFKAGWNDAVRSKQYTERILRNLTWKNLGWRFGKTPPQQYLWVDSGSGRRPSV